MDYSQSECLRCFKSHAQVSVQNFKMSNEGKKISFTFSKTKKPTLTNKANVESKEKIEYVDCFDGSKGKFSYKGNIKNEDAPKKELVIPMPSSRTSTDIVKQRIEEKCMNKNISTESSETSNSKDGKGINEMSSKTLEDLAAKEILSDLNNSNKESKSTNKLIINSNEQSVLNVTESSEADIDYENVPVSDFGLAMLRGMGWKPNSGIGKEPRMVATISPNLRPKGLGLGAKPNLEQNKDENKVAKETKSKK